MGIGLSMVAMEEISCKGNIKWWMDKTNMSHIAYCFVLFRITPVKRP